MYLICWFVYFICLLVFCFAVTGRRRPHPFTTLGFELFWTGEFRPSILWTSLRKKVRMRIKAHLIWKFFLDWKRPRHAWSCIAVVRTLSFQLGNVLGFVMYQLACSLLAEMSRSSRVSIHLPSIFSIYTKPSFLTFQFDHRFTAARLFLTLVKQMNHIIWMLSFFFNFHLTGVNFPSAVLPSICSDSFIWNYLQNAVCK